MWNLVNLEPTEEETVARAAHGSLLVDVKRTLLRII